MKTQPKINVKKWFTPAKYMPIGIWESIGTTFLNVVAYGLLILFLLPIIYMLVTSVKEVDQLQDLNAPLYPARQKKYTYEGQEYLVYKVPFDDGVRELALVSPSRKISVFVDPNDPAQTPIEWEGNWRGLTGAYQFHISLEAFKSVFEVIDVPLMMRNTLGIAVITEIGVIISSLIIAYGFARFPLPGGDLLFYIMIATILIPEKITLIPTYYMYIHVLNWDETWLPLVVPFFFGNAVYIFLMRQNFRSIPIETEEAAKLDGAGPLKTLFRIVLPQTWPVVITASLLHFYFIWNETRQAALYLSTRRELAPISFGIQNYQGRISSVNYLLASAVVIMIVPAVILMISQRYFMRDMVVTGLEK